MDLNLFESRLRESKVVLLQTSSKTLEMYLYDMCKDSCKSIQDTIIEVKSKNDLRRLKEVLNIQPPYSDRWLVLLDLSVTNKFLKDLIPYIEESTTILFFCTASKYSQFKAFKTACSKIDCMCELYINVLTRRNFGYLYTKLVPESNRLTKALYDYVVQSYSADIDAVFDLINALRDGIRFEKRSDISDVCGIGGNSIQSFVLSLLSNPPKTERGVKTVLRNRIIAGSELAESFGWSKFRMALSDCLDCMIDLKTLTISGEVYKSLQGIPEGYDDRKLSKYQRYLWRVKEVPLSRLLRLRVCVGDKVWKSNLDFLSAMYSYIHDIEKYEVIPNLVVPDESVKYEKEKLKMEAEKRAEEEKLKKLRIKTRLSQIEKYGYDVAITMPLPSDDLLIAGYNKVNKSSTTKEKSHYTSDLELVRAMLNKKGLS